MRGFSMAKQTFSFDVLLSAAITVPAEDEEAARRTLKGTLDCAECDAGRWPNGDSVQFEASAHGGAELYAIDGEDIQTSAGGIPAATMKARRAEALMKEHALLAGLITRIPALQFRSLVESMAYLATSMGIDFSTEVQDIIRMQAD